MLQNLLLGVTGGIAVYKIPELISRLRKQRIRTRVVMTRAAAEFVTPLTFQEVSQNPVHQEQFTQVAPTKWQVEHISLAKVADLVAVIPATANFIGKAAHGIADDLLTTTFMAAKCPKLIAPAMNTGMYQDLILQRNLKILQEVGCQIVGPEAGELLCGEVGPGRLASLDTIELSVRRLLTPADYQQETVLVTAGGTREPLDPIRFLGNRSSGQMGHALALAAYLRGAEVILVTTTESPLTDSLRAVGVRVERVTTTAEMAERVWALAETATLIIKAAAPADFRPEYQPHKIKKSCNEEGLQLKLLPNQDILAELGRRKTKGQLLVGFAAETEDLATNALQKLTQKKLDLIIGNLVDNPEVGMGATQNAVTIYTEQEKRVLPAMEKSLLAEKILDYILEYKQES